MCWRQLAAKGTYSLSGLAWWAASSWTLPASPNKAGELGYHPQVVLAGRSNDGMGRWVVQQLVLEMAQRGLLIAGTRVLVQGLSFEENCPDLRNTRVVDVLHARQRYCMEPVLVDPEEAQWEYGLLVSAAMPPQDTY